MPGHVAPAAQWHHPEGVAVVGMVQLDLQAAAVLAPVAHLDDPQLDQAPRDLADDDAAGIAPPVPPRPGGLQVAVPPRPLSGLLATPRALRRVTLPAPRTLLWAVRGVPLPFPRSAPWAIRRVVPPLLGPLARLAGGIPPSPAVVQMELHPVLFLTALRADLGERSDGTAVARHPQTSRCRWTSMKRGEAAASHELRAASPIQSSGSQAPAWGPAISEAPLRTPCEAGASQIPRSQAGAWEREKGVGVTAQGLLWSAAARRRFALPAERAGRETAWEGHTTLSQPQGVRPLRWESGVQPPHSKASPMARQRRAVAESFPSIP